MPSDSATPPPNPEALLTARPDHPRRAGGSVTVGSRYGHARPCAVPPLHELEAEVMAVVWERGEASVREVMDALNAATPKERAYTTVMTIMARLDTKGMLQRTRQGKTDFYRPTHTRDQYRDKRARVELESMLDEYGEVALAHIARQMAALDPQRRRALQRMARRK